MAKGKKTQKVEIEEKIELEESPVQEPIEKVVEENEETINVISVENKPINKKVVAEKQNIPKVFAPNIKVVADPDTLQFYKGRAYKVVGNGYGMWCDNGTLFIISDLK